MDGFPRIIEGVRVMFIKLFVLFFGDFRLRASPKGGRFVQRLVPVALHQNNRNTNMIGIGFDDVF